MDDEDAIRVEMAADFVKELEKLKKIFEKGEWFPTIIMYV